MTDESLSTQDDVAATTASLPMANLDGDWTCDIDGSRLELYGRHVVGTTEYEDRRCSSNPAHQKMVPR